MIEGMLTNPMLVLGVALLMLVINYRFRKYSRLLLWAEGIVAIVGTMLGIGLGWIRLFLPDGYPNFPVVVAVTIVIVAGAIFIIYDALPQFSKALDAIVTFAKSCFNVLDSDEAKAIKDSIDILSSNGKDKASVVNFLLVTADHRANLTDAEFSKAQCEVEDVAIGRYSAKIN